MDGRYVPLAFIKRGLSLGTYTVPANTGMNLDQTAVERIAGYVPVGIVGWSSSNSGVYLSRCDVQANASAESGYVVSAAVRNITASSASSTINVAVLYIAH